MPLALCERLMVGQGTDTYDPVCDLPVGHREHCQSTAAISQNHAVLRCDQCGHSTQDITKYQWIGKPNGQRSVDLFLLCANGDECQSRWQWPTEAEWEDE